MCFVNLDFAGRLVLIFWASLPVVLAAREKHLSEWKERSSNHRYSSMFDPLPASVFFLAFLRAFVSTSLLFFLLVLLFWSSIRLILGTGSLFSFFPISAKSKMHIVTSRFSSSLSIEAWLSVMITGKSGAKPLYKSFRLFLNLLFFGNFLLV